MKAVFFDADGTLLTFSESIGAQYAGLFREFGVSLSADEVERAIWATWKERSVLYLNEAGGYRTSAEQELVFWKGFFAAVCTMLGCDNPAGLFEAVYKHFASPLARPLKSGALDLLESLHERGLVVAVLSNHDARLRTVLTGSPVAHLLKDILTSDVTGYKKPAPEAFEYAASSIGIPGSEILHIGNDLHCDFKGALAAGWQALLLDEERKFEGDKAVRSVESLHEVLGELGLV